MARPGRLHESSGALQPRDCGEALVGRDAKRLRYPDLAAGPELYSAARAEDWLVVGV